MAAEKKDEIPQGQTGIINFSMHGEIAFCDEKSLGEPCENLEIKNQSEPVCGIFETRVCGHHRGLFNPQNNSFPKQS